MRFFRFLILLRLIPLSVTAIFCTVCMSGHHKNAEKKPDGISGQNMHEENVMVKPVLKLIRRHRSVDTHMDGPRCPFYPSCSAWGETAFVNHPSTAFLLLLDRMFYREWSRKKYYLPVPYRKSRDLRYFDPVSDSLPLSKNHRPSLFLEDFDPR